MFIFFLLVLSKKINFNKIYIIFLIVLYVHSYTIELKLKSYYNDIHYSEFIVQIISNKEERDYNNKYICLVKKLNNNDKYKNTKLILYVDKNEDYKFGDIVKIEGDFNYAKEFRNYKGYNYRRVLWQEKIYGTIIVENSKKIGNKKSIESYLNNIKLKLEDNIDESINQKEISSFLKSIILGDKSELPGEIKNNFRDSSLSHILAISGMHINYIIILLNNSFRFINSKKIKNLLNIIIISLYVIIIGGTPSAIRTVIMFIMQIISDFFHRKSNVFINWFVALIIVLIINPFNIENLGVWLSFGGTLGIIGIYSKIRIKKSGLFINYLYKNLLLSISVWICIIPVIVYNFNTISLTFYISNIIVSLVIVPVLILGFIFAILGNTIIIGSFISKIEILLVKIIFLSTSFISNLKISKIYIKTPHIIYLFLYYIFLIIILNRKKYKKVLKKLIILFFIISLILQIIKISKSNFYIYFIDVGQGDCTLIKTKYNKTILIDGGEGGSDSKFDEGKNTVLPYLLDRGITKIDYIMISHFDSDHVGGLFTIMEELKVGAVIISKQAEDSDNYQKFKKIVNDKKFKVIVVKKGDRLNVEKDVYIDILWPNNDSLISENALNNNSIVCKLYYKNFSILFTGDIEYPAENSILNEYNNNLDVLKSIVIKVRSSWFQNF